LGNELHDPLDTQSHHAARLCAAWLGSGYFAFAKFVDHIAPLRGSGLEAVLKEAYEFLRDMSLLIATGGVAYVTNVYQRRSSFVDALKEEWRDIIAAKSALFSYTQLKMPTVEIYLVTFCKLSETIDNMRSVYQTVGIHPARPISWALSAVEIPNCHRIATGDPCVAA